MSSGKPKGFATRAIHSGQDPSLWSNADVTPPISLSSIHRQDAPGVHRNGFNYGRCANPTRTALQTCLAALENSKHGFVFSSGVGALTVITTSLLKSGDHVITSYDMYGGTSCYFRECLSKMNIEITLQSFFKIENIASAIQPNTKMIWLETPTNPLLNLTDIKAVSEIAKSKNPDILIVVDNTFLTAYFQRPLELGADIVHYSLTKYINGHTDVIMGAALTNRDDIAEKIRSQQIVMGIIPSPFDCTLVIRSLKTLELRMQQHMKNGLAVGKYLQSHPLVIEVKHPYLPSHPQHELALKQTTGHSGMVSFYLRGDPKKFLQALKVFTLAGSLGDCRSLASLSTKMTHTTIPEDEKQRIGINSQLIRLSVGLETIDDIIDDLEQALQAAAMY